MKERYTVSLILGLLSVGLRATCDDAPRIAVIGGGIGGASISYFLEELFPKGMQIDLYEARTLGGRLMTTKVGDANVEAGGAIIHPKNLYMGKFVERLNLGINVGKKTQYGIWNGDEFVFVKSTCSLVTLAKLWYRYGIQLLRLHWHVDEVLRDFEKIYDLQNAGESFANVTALLSAMNEEFPSLMQMTMKAHLLRKGFTEKLIDEIVEAATVVNYGQNTDVIQSFVGLVSLAGSGANLWSVKNGNRKVPELLIEKNTRVKKLWGRVTKIRYLIDSSDLRQYEITYINKDDNSSVTSAYNIVIIAAPLTYDQEFPIEFADFPEDIKFLGSYQTTHVTFVRADRLNPEYFGLQNDLDCILSCKPNNTKISSIARVYTVDHEQATELNSKIWKIFSRKPLEADVIRDMFSNISEKKTVVWKAYPHYSTNERLDNFKLHDALYHINAIEWAASAMEMSAIGARNVAILAFHDFMNKVPHGSIPTEEAYKKGPHTKLNLEL